MVAKYDPNERNIIGEYPAVDYELGSYDGLPITAAPKYTTPITPRENFLRFMRHEEIAWIPNTAVDINVIQPHTIPDNIACGYSGGVDAFGVVWVPDESNPELPALVMPGNPKLKSIEQWRELEIPDPDAWDWEAIASRYPVDHDRANIGKILSAFYERMIALMDFQNAAMALVEDPEEVSAFLDVVADYNIKLIEKMKKYYDIDAVVIHDDWGGQHAPFFSRETLRETIVPAYKKMVSRAHELGVYVITHCCGKSECFVPEMLEIGSDMWQLQFNANPNLEETIKNNIGKLNFEMTMLVPQGLDDEAFREKIEEVYQKYTLGKNAAVMVFDEYWQTTKTQDDMMYEVARKICSGEL